MFDTARDCNKLWAKSFGLTRSLTIMRKVRKIEEKVETKDREIFPLADTSCLFVSMDKGNIYFSFHWN